MNRFEAGRYRYPILAEPKPIRYFAVPPEVNGGTEGDGELKGTRGDANL